MMNEQKTKGNNFFFNVFILKIKVALIKCFVSAGEEEWSEDAGNTNSDGNDGPEEEVEAGDDDVHDDDQSNENEPKEEENINGKLF